MIVAPGTRVHFHLYITHTYYALHLVLLLGQEVEIDFIAIAIINL